jgi:hypothetical protein
MPGAYRTADATVSARRAVAVTPSDATVLENTRALYVGGTGDLVVDFVEGGTVTLVGVPAGTLLPIQVIRVRAATGASNIVALY